MRKTYGPGYPRTLGALMAWSGLDPEVPAVTDATGTLDRRAFQNRVLRLAAGLRCGGVGLGSRVALWLPNGSGYLAAIFACARLGALAIYPLSDGGSGQLAASVARSRSGDTMGISARRFPGDFRRPAHGGSRQAGLRAWTAAASGHDAARWPAGVVAGW